MKPKIISSPAQKRLFKKLLALWPALKGSLALVHKPCIRAHCLACASGRKHPNYLLAYSHQGRRRCLYVPLAMVPLLKRALQNGRRIEQLLFEMGPLLLREYRSLNPSRTGPTLNRKRSSTKKPQPNS